MGTIRGMSEALHHVSTVVFEVPDAALAADLAARLEDRWACCALGEADGSVTIVFLSRHGESDFAQLVQRTAGWLHEHDLGDLPLRLHGRAFIRPRAELQPGS
jgi:hypothetical protein